MSKKIFLAVFIFSFACNNRSGETPKALENKKSTIEIVTKRGYEDLIESLYTEVVDKDEELKALERNLKGISNQQIDSTSAYLHFDGRNRAYYHSAANHIGSLSDSLLVKKMQELFNDHIKKYNTSVGGYQQLMDSVAYNSKVLSDLQTLIKLFKTLPLIEKYQELNRPDSLSIKGLIRQQEALIRYADSISKVENQ